MSSPFRSLWGFLLILFSVQILSAYYFMDQCHHQREAHSMAEHFESSMTITAPEGETHGDSEDFCHSGHCHLGHCSLLLAKSTCFKNFQFASVLGLPSEDKLVSLWGESPPWQPPRA